MFLLKKSMGVLKNSNNNFHFFKIFFPFQNDHEITT